jgi:hypothetical protein
MRKCKCTYCGAEGHLWKLREVDEGPHSRLTLICAKCIILAMSERLIAKKDIFVTKESFEEVEKVLKHNSDIVYKMKKPLKVVDKTYRAQAIEIVKSCPTEEVYDKLQEMAANALNEIGLEEFAAVYKKAMQIIENNLKGEKV